MKRFTLMFVLVLFVVSFSRERNPSHYCTILSNRTKQSEQFWFLKWKPNRAKDYIVYIDGKQYNDSLNMYLCYGLVNIYDPEKKFNHKKFKIVFKY